MGENLKVNNLIFPSIIIGLSIIISAWILGNAWRDSAESMRLQHVTLDQLQYENENRETPQLLDLSGLAMYLGITDDQAMKLMPRESAGETFSQIPYVKINQQYYFPVKAIDNWLLENEMRHFE